MFDDGGSNVRKYNTVNRRVFILKIAKGIIFTGIVARLFSLQITENKKYLTLSDKSSWFRKNLICEINISSLEYALSDSIISFSVL